MKKRLCRLCVMLLLLLGALVSLVPFYWLVRSSFMTMMEIYIMPPLLWSRSTTLETVSYTHLDVYKRQSQARVVVST